MEYVFRTFLCTIHLLIRLHLPESLDVSPGRFCLYVCLLSKLPGVDYSRRRCSSRIYRQPASLEIA